KKSGKRKNYESAPAAKRAKECHAIKWYPVNMVQFKPQGHPSTSKVTTVQSSQNVYENQSSRATYFKKNSTPVTHTITSSTFVPGQQTQASGGTLPSSAHTLVSLLSSPHLNLQTSVQGCQSQLIRQRQYHFCQDDLTVGKDIFDSSQLGNRIPVTNLPEHGKQIQTGLDQQHVLQNKSSLLLRTSQSAGSSIARKKSLQLEPQGHPSTSTATTVQSHTSLLEIYGKQSSRPTDFQKNSIPVTYTVTSNTFVPGKQTQASAGGTSPSAHSPFSILSPHLNLQTSDQRCQSQPVRQRQYHFSQDYLAALNDTFDSFQPGNRMPVTNLSEQNQSGFDWDVSQNKSSLLPGTSQSADRSVSSRCGGTSLHLATQQRRRDQVQANRAEVVPKVPLQPESISGDEPVPDNTAGGQIPSNTQASWASFTEQDISTSSEVPYQLWNISYCSDGPVFAFPIIGSKYGLTASEPSPSQRLPSTCLADNTAGGQVSLNTQALGASFMEQAGDQIFQNVQASRASLIQPGILPIDPSQQPAATVDQQPISHESPSGLDSISNSTIGVAAASDTAEQSGATSETDPSQQTAVTTDREPIKNESDSSQDAIMNNTVGVAQASDSAYHSEDLCTPSEIFGFSGQSDSVLEEGTDVFFELLTPTGDLNFVSEIIPFCITLREELPKEYKKLNLKANFEGVDTVPLEIENGKTLTGNIVSNKTGKVKVSVEYDGSDGRSIGYTDFTFTVNAQAILGEIVLVKSNQKFLFDALGKTPGIEGTSGGDPQEAASRGAAMGAGSSNLNKTSDALSIRVLTLLLYKAAELDGYEFLEMVFRTSAGKVVFKHYKNNSTLPEDVARANGHAILGDFLENVNKRLAVEAGNEDSSETINWLELKHAAEKEVCLPGTDDAQSVDSPGGDMNQSGYEADDEVSPLPSPADTDAIGSEMDDSQHESFIHADSGHITLDKNDSLDSIVTEAERQRHQIGNNQQAGTGSSFTNRDYSEEEIEPSPHGTDNVEKNSAQESSAGDCAGLIPDWAYTEEKRELEILFLDPLPDDVISYKADFEGLGVANLIRKNSYTLVGYNPSKGKMPLNHFAKGIENGVTALKKGGQQEHTLQSNQGERDNQCATEAEKGRTGSLNGIVVEEKQKFGGFTSGSGGSDWWSYLKSWLPFQDNSDNCSDNELRYRRFSTINC
ncbi:uncharacterized protein LOC111345264, partial [Stylophora pistillata]|uniref:uncharacterized protein LOC111345264 n=1 Tax=Stylophora pistillata TaxID=50429 RepID=UPI000C05177F